MGLTFNTWSVADHTTFDPVTSSMPGLMFSLILLIVIGVTAISSDYSSSTIRTTFIVNPHRIRMSSAKAILVGLVGIGVHAIAVPGIFLGSEAIYGSYGLETTSVTDSQATRFLLVVALVVPLTYALVPLSFAYLLRGTAVAITVAIGFLFSPFMQAPLLPAWVQQHVLRYLPNVATDSLSELTLPDAVTYLSQLPASTMVRHLDRWITRGRGSCPRSARSMRRSPYYVARIVINDDAPEVRLTPALASDETTIWADDMSDVRQEFKPITFEAITKGSES